MPAARPLKRRATPGSGSGDPHSNHSFQLTFASPSSLLSQLPSMQSGQTALALQTTISFAPNVTPGTYEAPPPSDEDILSAGDESSHSALFPNASVQEAASLPSQPVSKRRRKTTPASVSRATPIPTKASTKKSPFSSSKPGSPAPNSGSSPSPNSGDTPGHIPRPPNAFILFRSSFIRSQHISAETEGNHGTLSKIVGMLWHALSYEERQVWQTRARKAYAEHKKKYPGYSFRPVKDKSSSAAASANPSRSEREGTPATSSDAPVPKRKTRAVGPRDLERCEHIAALYARGLKGPDLDAAMREFDASRKPQTITPRFEAPLTAQAYAPPKEKEEVREVKVEKEDTEESSKSCRATTVEPMNQAEQPSSQMETQTRVHVPSTADIRPRRVRRSSSAPLLDAGFPISAPAPLYPPSNTHFLQTHQQPQAFQQFDKQHQENEEASHFVSSTQQYQNGQQQAYTPSFAYPQPHMHIPHMQDVTGLRKRSASSSPRLRRPSHAFNYPPINSNFFTHQMSVPYQHEPETQEPQPLPHAYGAAHPHLQRMQAQMQAHMQSHPEGQSSSVGLGLEFDQPGLQPSYNAGGSLSRQSTLTDISSSEEDSSNGYWNESVDFSGFSFSSSHGGESQAPVSTQPTHPGPFEAPPLSTAPSGTNSDELQGAYADMPCLVEPPLYQDFFQATGRVSQPPQLEIQTSWNSDEFAFDAEPGSAASVPPSSAVDLESVPPSAVSGVFDFPPPTSALDLQGGYMDYSAPPQSVNVPTPCSPDSQSMSGATSSAGVRTPIDETYVNWDHSCSTPAAVRSSPVTGFDVCSPAATDDDAMTRARTLALQAGFRAYLAHAEKMGAMDNTDGAFEQFVRFVQDQGVGGGGIGGRNNNGMVFGASQAQMANVM